MMTPPPRLPGLRQLYHKVDLTSAVMPRWQKQFGNAWRDY